VTPIRVVLAEDQPMVRAGFRALLDSRSDIEVVGEAATGVEAVEQVRASHCSLRASRDDSFKPASRVPSRPPEASPKPWPS
jgi:CheY-like chemotaxis protein